MGGTRDDLDTLTGDLVTGLLDCHVEAVICPAYIFLADVARIIECKKVEGANIRLGAQNICEHEGVANTGGISGQMLSQYGCRYVIVGHSERRQRYGETDSQVANKFIAAQQAGLIPVLCVGETSNQREQQQTTEVVQRQLSAVIDKAGIEAVCSAVIAYEPVWAIGTGKVATADEAQQVISGLRSRLGEFGGQTRLLYGGSVSAANARELFQQRDIDGALVGGASLIATDFIEICKLAELR